MSVPVLALNNAQVAEAIGVSKRTVDSMWASGQLPYVLVRGKRRTTRADLERWLASLQRQGPAGPVADEWGEWEDTWEKHWS
jgi:excisionase family DNA binding protein